MIKNEIISQLKLITNQVLNNSVLPSSNIENSTINNFSITPSHQFYVKFRTIAPKLRPLCQELEKRSNMKE